MHYENRHQYVYFLLSGIVAGVIIVLIYISVQGSDHRHRLTELQKIQSTLTFLKPEREWNYNNSWQYIGDPYYRHQIYSAYFDPRLELYHPKVFKDSHIYYGSVRVFAVLPLRLRGEIKCNYRYEDFFSDEFVAYEAQPIHEHFDMKYSAYTIMCPLHVRRGAAIVHLPEAVALIYSANPLSEQVPTYVPISYSKGDILAKPDKKLALCIGPMHRNYGDVLRLVEFIEIYRLLGADQFYVYRLSVTPAIDAVLEHYLRNNIVRVNDWNFHGYTFESEIRYEGILAEFNECIYRATFVDGYKYIAVVDLDEILMPLRYNTLVDFLRVIEDGRTSGFVFRNVFFFKQGPNDTKATPAGARNQFLYTQVKVKRTVLALPPHDRSKCIVNGRNTIEMGNHEVWRSIEGSSETYVSHKEALLFHYRNVCSGCKVEPLIVDFTSRRFGSIIWNQVDDVCGRVFPSGICPLGG